MEFTKVVDAVQALAVEQAVFSDDLAASEEKLVELMRQLGQAAQQQHLNQRGGLGYEQSTRPCDCGGQQRFVNHRARTLQTLFGSLELKRAYYHCAHCHKGCVPYDLAQGLGSRSVSVPLAKRVVELTSGTPEGTA